MELKRYFIFNIGSLHAPGLEEKLKNYFSKFGTVRDVFIRDQKGFGFVNIASEEELPTEHTLDGHVFKTDLAKPKGEKKIDAQRYFVAGLAHLEDKFQGTTNMKLKEYFEANGGVVKEVFVRRGKGFAFVSATGIPSNFLHNTHQIGGFEVKIDAAKPKEQKPPQREIHEHEGANRWDQGFRAPPPNMYRRGLAHMHLRRRPSYEDFQEKYRPEESFHPWTEQEHEHFGGGFDPHYRLRRETTAYMRRHEASVRERAYARRGGFRPSAPRPDFDGRPPHTRFNAY